MEEPKTPKRRKIQAPTDSVCCKGQILTYWITSRIWPDVSINRHSTTACCGQPCKWHMFWKWTCDGLCRLQVLCRFRWDIKSSFNCGPGPLSDTLQAGACIFPPFQKLLDMLTHVASLQFLPTGQYGLCFGYCFSGPFPQRTDHLLGAISWSP